MYNAPSVAYPVGRCAFQRWLLVGVLGLSLATMTAWAIAQPLSAAWWLAWLPLCLGCFGAWQAMRMRGVLQWMGHSWVLWQPSSHAHNPWQGGTLRLAFDAQQALLLYWMPSLERDEQPATAASWLTRRGAWLWLDKDNAPQLWQELRRAVHAQASVN